MLLPLSQLAAQTLRNSATVVLYLVVNLPHKLDRQIAAMLGNTVPVMGPKKRPQLHLRYIRMSTPEPVVYPLLSILLTRRRSTVPVPVPVLTMWDLKWESALVLCSLLQNGLPVFGTKI